eukprot:PhM_4_TR5211/c0_g1_i2/m.103688/K16302/CNNM; metal transporter CNNM
MDLKIMLSTGCEAERIKARRVLGVVKRHHHLLVTLLTCNAIVNEALPVFLNRVFTETAAIILAVTAVLMFGEIIPQSLMSANALSVSSFFTPVVLVLMVVTSPITYPIAKLLDWIVGTHRFELFGKTELKEVIRMHAPSTMRRSPTSAAVPLSSSGVSISSSSGQRPIDRLEYGIMLGAMRLGELTVREATKTRRDEIFMVSTEKVVDRDLVSDVMNRGFSRVPVYCGTDRNNIVGVLLAKTLLYFCFEAEEGKVKVGEMSIQPTLRLQADAPLRNAYDLFTSAHAGHLAIVLASGSPRSRRSSLGVGGDIVGVITLEDVLETMLQVDITDETDLRHVFPAQVAARNWYLRQSLRAVDVNAVSMSSPQGGGSSPSPFAMNRRSVVRGGSASPTGESMSLIPPSTRQQPSSAKHHTNFVTFSAATEGEKQERPASYNGP